MNITALLLICMLPWLAQAIEITPNHVYAEAKRIESDIQKIKAAYGIKEEAKKRQYHIHFQPRHVWQKTYEILEKINIYRRTEAYPVITVSAIQPLKAFPAKLVYDQTRRILVELELIKVRKGILSPTIALKSYQNKASQDVYQLFDKISRDIDLITRQGFTPSHVFAQALRLNADIELILDHLHIQDTSIPPIKVEGTTPSHVYALAITLLHEVTRLQHSFSTIDTDFSSIQANNNALPSDVFALLGLINSEVQVLKYALSLSSHHAPPAKVFHGKTPADVKQIVGWLLEKIRQIKDRGY